MTVKKPRTPKNLGAYPDVRKLLDTIIRHGEFPAEIRFGTKGNAFTWRKRAHHLRTLIRNENARCGREASSEYDILRLCIRPPDENVVIVERHGDRTQGELIIGGRKITPMSADEAEYLDGFSSDGEDEGEDLNALWEDSDHA